MGSNGEVRPPPFSAVAWDLVGLQPAVFGRVADEVVALLGEAERLFLGEEDSR